MDKIADGDTDHITTFEETLQRFVGLSSEEIWELQRILVRRVRCKLSESLSPEGKTAMKQVKQEMHERHVQRMNAPVSLVTELIDLGSKQTEENVQPERKLSKNIVLTVSKDDEILKPVDKVADNNKAQSEKETCKVSIPNGDSAPEVEKVADDIDKKADDNDTKVNEKVAANGIENTSGIQNDGNDNSAQIQEENVKERVGSSESSRNARVSSRGSSRNVTQENVNEKENVKEDIKDIGQTTEVEETIVNGQINGEATYGENSINDKEKSEEISQEKTNVPPETENSASS